MMQRFLLAALTLLVAVQSYAGCGQNPAFSTFIVQTTCSFETPCKAGEPQTLKLRIDTGCINWWTPCKPFNFDSCDTVEWNFGDGTIQNVSASGSVTHTWKNPGEYSIEVKIRNASGERYTYGRMIAVHPSPARVEWSKDLYSANETDSSITLTLVRSGDLSRPVPLLLSAGGPGTNTIEYVWEKPITIPAGATTFPVTININDDNVWRGEQRFDAYVHDFSGNAILPIGGFGAHAEIRIIDNEPGPVMTVGDATVVEGDAGRQLLRIPHTLSQPLTRDLMLWWQIGNGTAKRGEDWDTQNGGNYFIGGTLKAGQTKFDLEIYILGDTKSEPDEQIVITVDDPIGLGEGPSHPVQLSQAQITVTITDDDLFSLTSASTVSAGSKVPLTLATTQPSPNAITANVVTSDATIVAVPPSITLPANAPSVTFEVETLRPGSADVTVKLPNKNLTTRISARGTGSITARQTRLNLAVGEALPVQFDATGARGSLDVSIAPAGIARSSAKVELDANGTATLLVEGAAEGTAQMRVALPPEYDAAPAFVDIRVFSAVAPVIHDVTPKLGSTNGGLTVTIAGNNFSNDCAVYFGGIAATATQWTSEQTLIATTPRHAAGLVDVTVNCGNKGNVAEGAFRFVSSGRRRAVR